MHSLETRIAEWRKALAAAPNVSPETLDELEAHLRETVDDFVRSGMTESEAFERTVQQMGGASTIASEFQKLAPVAWLPIKLAIGAGIAAALVFALLAFLIASGPSSFLLGAHVFTVALGYTTTFLIGALGICFVAQRCLSSFSASRLQSVVRVTFVLGWIAVVLTALGIIFGMIWARIEWGRYWAWDIKETGAFCIVLWQLCFLVAHRFARGAPRTVLVASVLGNIVVALGWFGTNLLGSELHAYGTSYLLFLLAAILPNLAFFLAGFAPAGWMRLRKAS